MTKPRDFGMANAFVAADSGSLSSEARALIERRQRLLGPAYRLFYKEPLYIVRGEGVWLYDAEGNRYLDAYNNVVSVGHCHPRVSEALARQAATLNTHTRYLHDGILNYADRLLATLPRELGHLMLTCTGSEANDLAMRISKAFTSGAAFIVTECAYHGVTDAVAQLSPSLGLGVARGPHVRTVPPPDVSRLGVDGALAFARHVDAAIQDLQANGFKIAALLCDTVFSSDGVFTHPTELLAPAVDVVRQAGGLFIADEVQAGFARTGDAMWGFARHRVIPDLVTLGKPMANGHPVAGVVMRPEVIEEFGRKVRYFNTFGGNPVSCAAAMATLEVIEEERLQQNAREVGSYLLDGLRDLARTHPSMRAVRGAGLSIGVELANPETNEPAPDTATLLVNDLRRRGVLVSATGPNANVLKIRPPLIFSKQHADLLTSALQASMRCAFEH